MILEFSCSNYKSIKNRVLFSMIATKDDTNEDSFVTFDKYKVLRSSVIYGANGSGKSNFIEAIVFVKNLVLNSINIQPGQDIRQIPHKLLGIDSDSTYSIQFVKNDVRYSFGFTLNNMQITDEYLFVFPKGRQVTIYERNINTFTPGDRFKGKFDLCRDVLKPNRLFLSCAANFSSVFELEEVFSFFRDDLVVYRGMGTDNWMNMTLSLISRDERVKKNVIKFISNLGTGIKDIEIGHLKEDKQIDLMPILMPKASNFDDTKIVYDQFKVDLDYESSGIKKLIELAYPLVDIIKNNRVFICDEMEASLHEQLVYNFIQMFKNGKEKSQSQMIFTTHDTSLLDLSLFRRDQIWFTELKVDERSTDLYSLSEIRNVRKDENIKKGYISGKYGAIPMLNRSFTTSIKKEI